MHMGRGAAANQQDTNSRSRTSPATQAENTLGFRSMQVIFWLHRLKVVVAQPPGRRVRQGGHKTIRQRGGRPEPAQVPDRADRLEKQRRLSAHSAGKSIISYT